MFGFGFISAITYAAAAQSAALNGGTPPRGSRTPRTPGQRAALARRRAAFKAARKARRVTRLAAKGGR